MEEGLISPADGDVQALLQALLESTDDAILISDHEALPVLFNSAYARVMKAALDLDMKPGIQPHTRLADPAARAYWEGLHRRVLAGESFRALFSHAIEGMLRHFEVSYSPILRGGQVTGFCELTRDITERVEAEQALKESEAKLRGIFRAAPMAIGMVVDRVFMEVNHRMCEMLGYDREELIGRSARMVYPSDDEFRRVGTEKYMQIARGGLGSVDTRWVRKDGSVVEVVLTSSAIDASDLNQGVTFTAVDVSGRRQTERDLVRALLERDQQARERRQIEEQLLRAQKLEAVGRLAGGVAHDFNNILQIIFSNVDLALRSTPGEAPSLEHLRGIEQAARKAAGLTRQLLAFSRRQILKPKEIDLNDLMAGLLKMLRRIIGEDIDLEFAPGGGLGVVRADPGQLEQVIMNLCVNARDAMSRGGTLSLRTMAVTLDAEECEPYEWVQPGRFAVIVVRDTGCGLDQDTRELIFEPFFTTKEKGKGTGLGLSTVYGIVRQHGGFIEVVSEPGEGAEFMVYLPAATGSGARGEAASVVQPRGGSETVLVAEDEAPVRELLVELLRSAGYTVIAAADGDEAVRLFNETGERVQLAVLDVVMPRRGGVDVYQHIRAASPDTPVLFVSGYAAAGGTHSLPEDAPVIPKPFRSAELLRAIRDLLDRR